MNLEKLKEDIYKVPLRKLAPFIFYNYVLDHGCVIGHLTLLNGISKESLCHILKHYDHDYFTTLEDIHETVASAYGLDEQAILAIENAFDRHLVSGFPINSHDELWEIVKSSIDQGL